MNLLIYFVSQVNSLPAIVEEDIVSYKYGKQYAVKGNMGVLPGLQQYIDAAEIILNI